MQEPAKPRRRRLARKAGVVGLSLVAALALTGCWGFFVSFGVDEYDVRIHQKNTDDMIHACDNNPRGSLAHAECVLDVVRWTCHADPLSGFTLSECDQATTHNPSWWGTFGATCQDWDGRPEPCSTSMRTAIAAVRANIAERLVYRHEVGGVAHKWIGMNAP